jgi:hypothetical protein
MLNLTADSLEFLAYRLDQVSNEPFLDLFPPEAKELSLLKASRPVRALAELPV